VLAACSSNFQADEQYITGLVAERVNCQQIRGYCQIVWMKAFLLPPADVSQARTATTSKVPYMVIKIWVSKSFVTAIVSVFRSS
jgi:hypothetical protein